MGRSANTRRTADAGHRGRSVHFAKYIGRRGRPRSHGWKTFPRNHAAGIASIHLFVVRSISFKLLYGLVILGHLRRRLIRVSVTTSPTAEWIAGQVTEAFPWDEAPRHLLRDHDGSFGPTYTHRIRAMGSPKPLICGPRYGYAHRASAPQERYCHSS